MAKASNARPKWGDLNIALNGLKRGGVFSTYTTQWVEAGSTTVIELSVERGADQAEVLRTVREALPAAFLDATIRTKSV